MRARGIRRTVEKAWVWQLAAAVGGLAFALLAVQQLSGVLASREIDFGNKSGKSGLRKFMIRDDHHAGIIPGSYRTNLVARSAVVLEDGRPLPHRQTSIRAVNDGFGRYSVTPKYAHFRPSDGGDPNTNGRRYTLRVPRKVKPGLLWGVFTGGAGCLFLAFRCPSPPVPASGSRWAEAWRRSPWLEFALVAAFASGGALWALWRYADLSSGGLCVMGKPYSDAIGWHEVAANLGEGFGFQGAFSDNRPFYPILQAIAFLVAGESLAVAHATNVVLLALGALFVYYATRRYFSPVVALATFAFVLVAPEFQRMAPTLLTELTAYTLGAVGLYLLALGCAPGDSRHHPWCLLLAGVFLGCSNLARPFTLLALPLAGLAVVYAGITSRWGWRKTFLRGCLLGAGIVVVFLPWSLRQKRVLGTWTLSINSSELLYGAAMPEGGGKWNPRQFEQAEAAGVDPADRLAMSRFFSDRLGETIRADPGDYARRMLANYVQFFREFSLGQPAIECVLALAVLIVLAVAAHRARSILPLLGLPLFWLIGSWAGGWRGYELLPAALVVVLLGGGKPARLGVIVALVFLAASGVLSALVGNFGLRRGLPIFEWLFVAVLAAAAVVLAHGWSVGILGATARLRSSGPPPALAPARPEGRAPLVLALSVLGFFLLGGLGLIARTFLADDPASRKVSLGAPLRAEALEATRAAVPVLRDATPAMIYCEVARVGDFRWEIPAHHDVGHWSRLFERRPHARTTVYLHPGIRRYPGAGFMGAHFRGPLDALDPHTPFVVVGLLNHDPDAPLGHDSLVIEALALIPYEHGPRRLRTADARFFAPSGEALARLSDENAR